LLVNYSRNQRDTVVLFPLLNYTQQQQQATLFARWGCGEFTQRRRTYEQIGFAWNSENDKKRKEQRKEKQQDKQRNFGIPFSNNWLVFTKIPFWSHNVFTRWSVVELGLTARSDL